MTLDDVRVHKTLAFLPLPNGAMLRYQPEDGTVRVLAYPHRREEGDRLPILHEDIPLEGWKHLPACTCVRCRPSGKQPGEWR